MRVFRARPVFAEVGGAGVQLEAQRETHLLQQWGLGATLRIAAAPRNAAGGMRAGVSLRMPLAQAWSGATAPLYLLPRADLHIVARRRALSSDVAVADGGALQSFEMAPAEALDAAASPPPRIARSRATR